MQLSLQGISTSKKDLSTKDFLTPSIISAVTRKRKKHQSTFPTGSSTDEDSEHEPIKASNYEEMSGNSEIPGDSEARQSRHPPRKSEDETKEVNELEGKPEQVEESQEEERVTEDENVILQKEQDEIKVEVSEREQTGSIQSWRPLSFLYSQHSVSGLGASLQLTNSSSSTCSNPPQPLNITHSLARRKLREERVRPHSLYVEQKQTGEERASHTHLDFSRVKASLVRGQEKLRQAVLPGRSSREPSLQQDVSKAGQPNSQWSVGSREPAASRLTRHATGDETGGRHHTVLVNVPGEG